MDNITSFWERFLIAHPSYVGRTYIESFHFEITEASANALLALVLSGQKTATSSSLFAYHHANEKIPIPGDLSIVTNYDGIPHAVIETQKITVIPFKHMTFDICKREGEDDSLASWQTKHIHFFREDGKIMGYQFDVDMPIVYEDFKVIYKEIEHEKV